MCFFPLSIQQKKFALQTIQWITTSRQQKVSCKLVLGLQCHLVLITIDRSLRQRKWNKIIFWGSHGDAFTLHHRKVLHRPIMFHAFLKANLRTESSFVLQKEHPWYVWLTCRNIIIYICDSTHRLNNKVNWLLFVCMCLQKIVGQWEALKFTWIMKLRSSYRTFWVTRVTKVFKRFSRNIDIFIIFLSVCFSSNRVIKHHNSNLNRCKLYPFGTIHEVPRWCLIWLCFDVMCDVRRPTRASKTAEISWMKCCVFFAFDVHHYERKCLWNNPF